MRFVLSLALLAATPALAGPPQCALPDSATLAAAPAELPAAGAAATVPQAAASVGADVPPLPADLQALPFVRQRADSGATIRDFGIAHGLRTIAAKAGDQFMFFQVTADGQAGVSGAVAELTPEQLAELAGSNMMEIGTAHGLRGLFVRSGPQFQVFYATPDGQRVIPGVLWDAAGENLTKGQTAHIPGVVPTVVVGGGALPPAARGAAALPLLEKAFGGATGPASAPRLWMMVDPQCPYSVRAAQALQPYADKGRLRLVVVPLSSLDSHNGGQSTRSALALLSKPSDQLVAAWQDGNVSGPPAPEAAERLRANMAISAALGVQGVPSFVWRKQDGNEGRYEGLPPNIEALLSNLGS